RYRGPVDDAGRHRSVPPARPWSRVRCSRLPETTYDTARIDAARPVRNTVELSASEMVGGRVPIQYRRRTEVGGVQHPVDDLLDRLVLTDDQLAGDAEQVAAAIPTAHPFGGHLGRQRFAGVPPQRLLHV